MYSIMRFTYYLIGVLLLTKEDDDNALKWKSNYAAAAAPDDDDDDDLDDLYSDRGDDTYAGTYSAIKEDHRYKWVFSP